MEIGDKANIKPYSEIKNILANRSSDPPGWNGSMDKWCGKGPFKIEKKEQREVRHGEYVNIYTMCGVSGSGRNWWWRQDWLEQREYLDETLFNI